MYPIENYFYSTSKVIVSRTTCREIDMKHLKHDKFGDILIMNDEIQSATADERLYHETLVHPAMISSKNGNPEKVLIVGGGEGCTAREVLRWESVKHVDMIDWDSDIVEYFSQPSISYLWNTRSVWTDDRLNIEFGDIWEILEKREKSLQKSEYDCIIVDLFDPKSRDESEQFHYNKLIKGLANWLTPTGSIVFYTGMRNIFEPRHSSTCTRTTFTLEEIPTHKFLSVAPYKTWIPSFGGESTFVIAGGSLANLSKLPKNSHLRRPGVWESYLTWNEISYLTWSELGQTGLAT